jgi:hypothetical protein
LYGPDFNEALHGVLKWGDNFTYRNGGGGGAPPDPMTKGTLIQLPPMMNVPHLVTLDLEIIDASTGLPPGNLFGGRFRIMFGAGNDARVHEFEPGIHSLICSSLRVDVVPHFTLMVVKQYEYRAHCMIQDGVSPSYTYVV